MRPRRALLIFLAGCGSPAEPTVAVTPARDAATTAWLECTESVRAPMEHTLLARYHLAKVDERDEGLRCVTIQVAQQPAFFVELTAAEGDHHRRLLGVLATDGTTELVGLRDAHLPGGHVSFETLDLDGDHSDEIIVRHGAPHLEDGAWIDLIVLRGRGLSEIIGPRISYADPDLDDDRCRGSLSTERAGSAMHLVVTTSASTGRSEHCLAQGRHVFALEVDRLVERVADDQRATTR